LIEAIDMLLEIIFQELYHHLKKLSKIKWNKKDYETQNGQNGEIHNLIPT